MQRQHVLPNTEEQVCLMAKASERDEVNTKVLDGFHKKY